MKGKWARGITPRFFAWIIKGHLAISERPGGYARNHRKVRRHEEILWLRSEGFTRVVSLLPSPRVRCSTPVVARPRGRLAVRPGADQLTACLVWPG